MNRPSGRKVLVIIILVMFAGLVWFYAQKQTPEGRRRESDARMERMKQESTERSRKNLEEKSAEFELAKQKKDTLPSKYLSALTSLSSAYDGVQEADKANAYRDEAIGFFVKNADQMTDSDARTMFRLLEYALRRRSLSKTEFKSTFEKVITIANRYSGDDVDWRDEAMDCLSDANNLDKQLKISLLEFWLSQQNNTPKFVSQLRSQLASAYESAGNIEKADSFYKEVMANVPGEYYVSTKLGYAIFCARHGRGADAQKAVNEAGTGVKWNFTEGDARSLEWLLKTLDGASLAADRVQLIDTLLANANMEILKVLDPVLEKQIEDLIASAKFEQAEQVIRKRVNAQEKVVAGDPGTYWLMKLSDICLVTGRTDESNKILARVMNALALTGQSSDSIKLARVALLERIGKENEAKELKTSIPKAEAKNPKTRTLKYALLASNRISLSGNLRFSSYNSDQSPYSHLKSGKNGNICCPGKVTLDGNLTMDGIVFSNTEVETSSHFREPSVLPVPSEDSMIAPAFMKQQEQAAQLPANLDRNDITGGDYTATELKGRLRIERNPSRPIRIFLRDGGAGSEIVNLNSVFLSGGKPIDFQIWYDGTKRIVLGNSRLCAVIYAPNAPVEINNDFNGAIVASSITGRGNITIQYDEALKNKQLAKD